MLTILVMGGFFSASTFAAQPWTIDTGFNIWSAFDNVVRSLAIQNDGKILVGGHFTSYSGSSANRIIRLNADWTIDTGFNIWSAFNNVAFSLAIQSDGKILVGGQFTSYNWISAPHLIRLYSQEEALPLLSYLNWSYQREDMTFLNYSFWTARKAFITPWDTHIFNLNFINNSWWPLTAIDKIFTPFHFYASVGTGIGSWSTGNVTYQVKFFVNP